MTWVDDLLKVPVKDKIVLVPWKDLTESVPIGPDQDVGVLTGHRSKVFAVDCDNEEAVQGFLTLHPEATKTFTVRTKRGKHFWFKLPDFPVPTSHGKLLPKIDVQGERSMCVIFGENKEIENDVEPIECPASLKVWLRSLPERSKISETYTPVTEDDTTYAERIQMGKDYCLRAEPTVAGRGEEYLTLFVAKHLAGLKLPAEQIFELMDEYYSPRCTPPWDDENKLRHKVQEGMNCPSPDPYLGQSLMNHLKGLGAKEEALPKTDEEVIIAGAQKQVAMPFDMLVQILQTADDWKDVLRYDVLSRKQVAVNPPIPLAMANGNGLTAGDEGEIRVLFAAGGYKVSAEEVRNAVNTICQKPGREYNPILEYFQSLPEPNDGLCRLDTIHEDVLNSPDGPMASRIVKKQIVAAAKRAIAMPGLHQKPDPVDHRTVVVLVGPQAAGKSSFIKQLAKEIWYGKLEGDLADKDVKRNTFGKLLVEMAEMNAGRKDRRALKSYISDTSDEMRLHYERNPQKIQRSFVIFGTDNNLKLDDPTGNTRFVPVRVEKMNQTNHELLIDRYWAEAYALACAGYDHHLDAEERAWAAQRAAEHEIEDTLADELQERLAGIPFVTLKEAQTLVIGTDETKKALTDGRIGNGFNDALIRIGCHRYKSQGGKRGWLVPASISTQPKRPNTDMWLKQDVEAQNIREGLAAKVMS